jgi:hypothetical protein
MSDESATFPMVVLLLNQTRRVDVAEAAAAVSAELGHDAASTVRAIGDDYDDDPPGMHYIQWRLGSTPYHIGTSPEPYLSVVGVGKVDSDNQLVDPINWRMREEVPPDGEELCNAWMSHTAWLYIDALVFHGSASDADKHLQNVLKISRHFIDHRCILVWLWGKEPKVVALPTSDTVESLRRGRWPA